MKYTLEEILRQYVKPTQIFSIVCSTGDGCANLFNQLEKYYQGQSIFACREKGSVFDNLTVLENIFLEKVYCTKWKRRQQEERCQELLDKFEIRISPHTMVGNLTEEEKQIVTLLHAIVRNPKTVFLNRTIAMIGYYYFDVFLELLNYLNEQGSAILLITSRWEDTLRICSHIAVMPDNSNTLTVLSVREIECNPTRLILALSNYDAERDEQIRHMNLQSALNSMFAGSRLLQQSRSLEEALVQITILAKREMQACSCLIYLRDYNGKILSYYDRTGGGERFKIKENIVEKMILNSENVLFIAKNRYDISAVFDRAPEELQMLLCYPIFVAPERIGLIQIAFDTTFLYGEEYLMTLKVMSNEVSRIIQNSQLMNNTTLLQESNHRIKNNLQMMVSLLYMQKNFMRRKGEKVFSLQDFDKVCEENIQRLKTIAEIHDFLARKTTPGTKIPLGYIVETITKIFGGENMTIYVKVDDVEIESDKGILLAMALNELVNNSYKYAFGKEKEKENKIEICCAVCGNQYVIEVSDNGSGIQGDISQYEKSTGIGITIIQSLIRQLQGTISFRVQNGTHVRMTLPFGKQLS